eukprot:2500769-Pyramimonas_sp.AAC.1
MDLNAETVGVFYSQQAKSIWLTEYNPFLLRKGNRHGYVTCSFGRDDKIQYPTSGIHKGMQTRDALGDSATRIHAHRHNIHPGRNRDPLGRQVQARGLTISEGRAARTNKALKHGIPGPPRGTPSDKQGDNDTINGICYMVPR